MLPRSDTPFRPLAERRWLWWLLGPLLGLGLLFRLSLVRECHYAAVDGMQYYHLSQELLLHGRFAYGPSPAPLAYSRLPGYSLFLAHVAVRQAPLELDPHLLRATRANAVLDVLSALLVAAILRELCRGRKAPLVALLGATLTLVCPLLFTLASHALTETLATTLATLEVYLALRLFLRGSLVLSCLLGVVAGAAQLVRADAVSLLPAIVLAVLAAPVPWPRRLLLAGGGLLCAVLVFSPWPVRNLTRFGKPYFASWYWRSAAGVPLPTGIMSWARTWTTGDRSEWDLDPRLAFGRPIYPLPGMYDDPDEQRQVVAVITRYNQQGLTPEVDAAFQALGAARTRRAPLRTHLILPLRRMPSLYATVPGGELTMVSHLLGLPRNRVWFHRFDLLVYGLSLLGIAALCHGARRSRELRILLGVLLGYLLTRSLLLSYTIPLGLSQRHLVEAYPVLLVFASYGVGACSCFHSMALRMRRRPEG